MPRVQLPAVTPKRKAWNKGRIIGQKRPPLPKQVWAIRARLELACPFPECSGNNRDFVASTFPRPKGKTLKVLYKTSATATGGRSGVSKLDDGSFEVSTVPPGSKKEGVNPEQLFALGYSACFDNAMLMVAQRMKLTPSTCSTTVEVGLAQLESGGFGLDVDLYANIAGLSEPEARSLLTAAHNVCPYSNALHGNVDVRLHLNHSS